MPTPKTRLVWIQTAPEPGEVYVAECGPYDFEIRITRNMGYLVRMWQIRPEDSPLLVWEKDGYSLEEAKGRAERLADQHVPAVVVLKSPIRR
jgi:hypothetical protein